MLAEHPGPMRALIRGLSSYEFEEAVLSAYDAMRGAGVRVEELAGFATPPGSTVADIGDTLRAIRRESLTTWNHMQREQLESRSKARNASSRPADRCRRSRPSKPSTAT
jgi:hypothetical protein